MLDIQKLFDAMSDAARQERSSYHVTLGQLYEAVRDNPGGKVIVDGEQGLGDEHSYRGDYADLAFGPRWEPTSTSEVKAACDRALSNEYEGYKGGEYRYDDRTPLWFAGYGNCGPAIVALAVRDGNIHLTTKNV